MTICVMGLCPPVHAPGYFHSCFTGSGGGGGGVEGVERQDANNAAPVTKAARIRRGEECEFTEANLKGSGSFPQVTARTIFSLQIEQIFSLGNKHIRTALTQLRLTAEAPAHPHGQHATAFCKGHVDTRIPHISHLFRLHA